MEAIIADQQTSKSGQDINRQRLELLGEEMLGRGSRMSHESQEGEKAQVMQE